jgi:MarR family transcriptional regulator, organic hydroperoxide resistance regulator
MSRVSLDEFGERLVVLLPALMRQLWSHERKVFSRDEITLPQLLALTHLQRHGSCTMRALARALQSRESSATGLVDRMEALKLARRVRSRSDRRVVTVELTAAGKQALRQIQSHRRRAFMEMFRPVDAAERSRWLELIEKLVKGMSTEEDKDRGES